MSSPLSHAVYTPHWSAVTVDAGLVPALYHGLAGPDQLHVGGVDHAANARLQLLGDGDSLVVPHRLPEHLHEPLTDSPEYLDPRRVLNRASYFVLQVFVLQRIDADGEAPNLRSPIVNLQNNN